LARGSVSGVFFCVFTALCLKVPVSHPAISSLTMEDCAKICPISTQVFVLCLVSVGFMVTGVYAVTGACLKKEVLVVRL
jgi:hypothetical protein